MIRTLVVDDEPLARERIASLLRAHDEIEVVGECEDGASAVAAILDLRPQLVLLDVQMPEYDGFDVLQAIVGEHQPAVIFVTAYDEYALRAFDVHALDYVLKPIDPERFERALQRALQTLTRSSITGLMESVVNDRPERLVARSGRRIVLLRPEEIEWIEAAGNYLRLATDQGDCLLRGTLKHLAARLDSERFIQVHRSLIVARDRVMALEPYGNGQFELRLRSGHVCHSSRSFRENVCRLTGAP
jgi:two-component system LytT family response regulator